MKFTLNIDSDNAALVDDASGEVARMLVRTTQLVREGRTEGALLDINGNTVGSWGFDLPESPAERSARVYLARARMNPDEEDALTEEHCSESNPITGTCYTLQGGGPSVWFYMVKDNHAQEEFGVIEHSHAGPSTYAIVPTHDAEIIDLALRRESAL